MRYEVDVLKTGLFSRTLDPRQLTDALNNRAAQGWMLARTIKEERRGLLFTRREAHFLIFQREATGQP